MGAEPRGSARPRLSTSLLQPRSPLRPGLLARTACMASELDLVPVYIIFMPAEAQPMNTQLIRNASACVCVFEAAPSEPFQHHVNHGRAPGKRLHRQTVQGRRATSEVGDWWTERRGLSQRWLTQRASGKAGNPGGRVPVLQMRSPRPQEGRWLPQGHPCSQQMMRPTPLCLLLPGKQPSPSCGSRA